MIELNTLLKRVHYGKNIDVKHRVELINNQEIHIIFLSSLISSELLIKLIESLPLVNFKDNIVNNLAVSNFQIGSNLSELSLAIFEGNAILYYKKVEKWLIAEIKSYPSRGISIPEVERSVRGAKDGFNENLINNIGLIRRRIKDQDLMIKSFIVSKDSKMIVALIYMKNYCPKWVVKELSKRIETLKLDSLIMTESALEDSIFPQHRFFVPAVRYTERPDVASINLMNGKCVILVDTSCNAIITPSTIMDHLKNVEEFKQNKIIGSFTKILRIIGTLISIFLVPIFIVMTLKNNYDNGIIPSYDFEASSPTMFQVVAITIFIEIIRIAVVHTPNALISAISLLAAIVLGDISTELGLFSPEILLSCSLAAICNYATPSYELSLAGRIVSLFLVIMTCIWGLTGLIIGILLVFLYYVNINILDTPFLFPFCPFDIYIKNVFIRKSKNKKR